MDNLLLELDPVVELTASEVFTKSIDLIAQLPIDSFEKKAYQTAPTTTDSGSHYVAELLTISGKQVGHIGLADLKNELIGSWQEGVDREEVTSADLIHRRKKYSCGLCFDERASLDDCVLVKSCGHALCVECARDYVDSRLGNALGNAGRFDCPSCEKRLDLSLMISYAGNGSALDTYLRLSAEQVLFGLRSYKRCPAANCSRVLKADLISSPYGVASCVCGFKVINSRAICDWLNKDMQVQGYTHM